MTPAIKGLDDVFSEAIHSLQGLQQSAHCFEQRLFDAANSVMRGTEVPRQEPVGAPTGVIAVGPYRTIDTSGMGRQVFPHNQLLFARIYAVLDITDG